MVEIKVYTDGSAISNSKSSNAGWACYWPELGILRSGAMVGTNNMAELRAIDYALWYTINRLDPMKNSKITIHTDSEYCIGVISGEKCAYANLDQIGKIRRHIEELEINRVVVEFKHVFAHTRKTDEESRNNEIVDNRARMEAMRKKALYLQMEDMEMEEEMDIN